MKNQQKHIPTPYELFYCEGLDKNGWAGLTWPILNAIKFHNKDLPEDQHAIISQIKEKWGSACYYIYAPFPISRMACRAEEASDHICMECGSPFNVGKTHNGWITTLCEECAKDEIERNNWSRQYNSVQIDKFIEIYIMIRYWVRKKHENITYKTWKYKGYAKYFFNRKKYENTCFNWNRYKKKKG